MKQTESFCRACAFQLIDIALSEVDEETSGANGERRKCEGSPPPHPAELRYDHYEVCQLDGVLVELGRGSMGITYKAVDTHLGCPVALKIINARNLAQSSGRERLLREARTAAGIRHQNIASVFHLGLDREHCYFAMEFIEGVTLEERVRRDGRLPAGIALDIAVQVARALRAAHERRFIHRDIKPTNIMLVDGDHSAEGGPLVKVIDFGLVKAIADPGLPCDPLSKSYFAGTPHYASPEQLNTGTTDARSDIYSLGMCLVFMLSGETPEQPPSSFAEPGGLFAGLNGVALSSVPTPVLVLVEAMISTDPALRPQSAVELLRALQECVTGLRLTQHNGRARAPRVRVASIVAAACCTLAILVAVSALSIRASRESRRDTKRSSDASIEARVFCSQAAECFAKARSAENARAIELYEKAIAIAPTLAEAHAGLASAYFHGVSHFGASPDQLSLAIACARRATVLDPKSSKGFTVLGAIHSYQGRHWDALAEVAHAVELNPHDGQALRSFALLWDTVGQPQRSLPWAVAATRAEPTKAANWNAAGEASVDLCLDEQAESFYQKCLEIDPSSMAGHCGMLRVHLLQGKFAQALEDWNIENSLEPGAILPLTLRAQIAFFSGDRAEAEALYRRLITMNRGGMVHFYGSVSYLSALGYLRCEAGSIEEGKSLLEEAAKLHIDNAESSQAIYDLAAIRAAQGRAADALLLFRQALSSGWIDVRSTQLDPRFAILRTEPIFRTLLENLRRHVLGMQAQENALLKRPLSTSDYPVGIAQ